MCLSVCVRESLFYIRYKKSHIMSTDANFPTAYAEVQLGTQVLY